MPGSRRTQEQWESLVSGWQRSGLSRRAYCERHGVSSGSLRRWEDFFARQDEGEAVASLDVPVKTTAEEPDSQAPIDDAHTGLADLAEKAQALSRQLGSLSTRAGIGLVPAKAAEVEPAQAVPPVEPIGAPLIQLQANPASTENPAEPASIDRVGIETVPPLRPDVLQPDLLPPDALTKGVEVRALSAPAQPHRSGSGSSKRPVVVSAASVTDAPATAAHASRRGTVKSASPRSASAVALTEGSSTSLGARTIVPDSATAPATAKASEPAAAPEPSIATEPSLTREQWRALAGGWLLSGMTQTDYCARHGISVESLRHWRGLFAQERTGAARRARPKHAGSGSEASGASPESDDQAPPVAVQPALPSATSAGAKAIASMARETPPQEQITTVTSPAPVTAAPLNGTRTIQTDTAGQVSVHLDKASRAPASVLDAAPASVSIDAAARPGAVRLRSTPRISVDSEPLRVQPEEMTEPLRTRDQWRAVAADWLVSGLTQNDYCERNGISVDSFCHWWELFTRDNSAASSPGTADLSRRESGLLTRESGAVSSTPAQRIRDKAGSPAATTNPLSEPVEKPERMPVEVTPSETTSANPARASAGASAPAEPLRQVTLQLTPVESIAPMGQAIAPDISAVGAELLAAGDWVAPAPSTQQPMSVAVDGGSIRSSGRTIARESAFSKDQEPRADIGRKLDQGLSVAKGWLRRLLNRTVERVAAVSVPRRPVEPDPQVPAQAYQSGSASASAEGSPIYTHTRTITLDPEHLRDHRVITDFSSGEAAQSYKILRTQVLQRSRSNGWRTLGITATRQGHGKTLTALNLAISLANEVNQTVLLADLDLRRPSLSGYLCAEKLNGISDYLIGRYGISEVLINPGIKRLVILPGNEPLINSSEQLSSPRMVQLVEELKTRYPDRIVLFDLPPLLMSDDVMAFAPNLDALLLVLEEGKTTREELRRAYELLEGQNILGTVLNKSVYNLGAPGYGGQSY